jgi:hypothetical protein
MIAMAVEDVVIEPIANSVFGVFRLDFGQFY